MRGRWAAGIEPRNFAWILKERLAVSERPGGFASHHRRVRRQEEILWLHAQGFTRVVSLLPSTHNLHAYDELQIPSAHYAVPAHGDARPVLEELYVALFDWLHDGERVLLHMDELGEQLAGVVAGFLLWSGLLPGPPQAVSVVEQLLRRQMGHAGRLLVATAVDLPVRDGAQPRRRSDTLDAAQPAVLAPPRPAPVGAPHPSGAGPVHLATPVPGRPRQGGHGSPTLVSLAAPRDEPAAETATVEPGPTSAGEVALPPTPSGVAGAANLLPPAPAASHREGGAAVAASGDTATRAAAAQEPVERALPAKSPAPKPPAAELPHSAKGPAAKSPAGETSLSPKGAAGKGAPPKAAATKGAAETRAPATGTPPPLSPGSTSAKGHGAKGHGAKGHGAKGHAAKGTATKGAPLTSGPATSAPAKAPAARSTAAKAPAATPAEAAKEPAARATPAKAAPASAATVPGRSTKAAAEGSAPAKVLPAKVPAKVPAAKEPAVRGPAAKEKVSGKARPAASGGERLGR